METINIEALHDVTGEFVRRAGRGERFRVCLEGVPTALLIPDEPAPAPGWDEIMAEVRARRAAKLARTPNPVLAERSRRNYAARLRG